MELKPSSNEILKPLNWPSPDKLAILSSSSYIPALCLKNVLQQESALMRIGHAYYKCIANHDTLSIRMVLP